jgi:hypothetical protein
MSNSACVAIAVALTEAQNQRLEDIKQVLQAHGYRCRKWQHKLIIRTPGWRYELVFQDEVWTLEPWNTSQRYQQLFEAIGMTIVEGGNNA